MEVANKTPNKKFKVVDGQVILIDKDTLDKLP